MSKELIIVESPTKARTLAKFLTGNFEIVASYGHIRDLPKSKFGVDEKKDFAPNYVVPKEKEKLVSELKKKYNKAKDLVLATDPDREGEAIAWHISELLQGSNSKGKASRIVFHEITKDAVLKALESPRSIDMNLVNSQQARRILDRIVGYKLSPLLWRKIRRGLSAGRVQSIALKFIAEREKEVAKFKPEEYWSLTALLSKKTEKEEFRAELAKFKENTVEIKNEKEAKSILKQLESAKYVVESVTKREMKKSPYPPFTTSTLVQTASNKFGFTSKKTMKIAQDLYEEGLITYMRTDSVNLAVTAVSAARDFIIKKYGKNNLSSTPRVYQTKSKLAQEAHEAVRPTDFTREPDSLKKDFDRDHLKLYRLIWLRTVACQMIEATYDQTAVEIKVKDYLFKANGSILKSPGWLSVYGVNHNQDNGEEKENKLPELKKGEVLNLKEVLPEQHFTEPPSRYTEATLIKELEEKGIGRPSTYAPILSTIQERRYVEKIDRRFQPTPLGVAVCDFLIKYFPAELDADFTAKMEDKLDEIANGGEKWAPIVADFYKPFNKHVGEVNDQAERVKIATETTDEVCELCGKPMVIRYGRFGRFLACSGFPECKGTKTYEEKLDAKCPECGSQMIIRRTKKNKRFYGCSSYPKCHWMAWYLPKKSQKSKVKSQN